jgi:Bacterial Ig-like domain (group 3)
MNRRLMHSFAAAVLSAALLVGQPAGAHNLDPFEAAPKAPAAAAQVEILTGDVKELVVEDRVANATIRYRSLVLADGTQVKLKGQGIERLANDSRVEVTGRRNGKTLFISAVREVGRAAVHKTASAGEVAYAEGELRMYHVDYLEASNSRMEFDVLGANDEVTQLRLGVHPEAIQRGMRVVVRGLRLPDGAIEPDTITITALPDDPPDKANLKATKTDNVLVILMRFTNSPANPFTQAQVQSVVAGGPGSGSVAEYFKEVSYGQQLLNVTVTPWLSTGAATPANCAWQTMGTLGRNAATAAGYTLGNYHKLVYVFPNVSSCGWLGLGYIGVSGAWINGSNSVLVYGHELGHNFGLLHAGSIDCGVKPIGGSCTASEYGDPFGIMGNSTTMHLNAFQKADLGWITTSAVKTHTTGNVTYTLNPIETAGGSAYAVKVPAAANRTYWLEYRRPIGFDAGLASYPNNGAQVRVATPFETQCGGCDSLSNDTQFLDMTPGTSTFTDGTLLAGSSYTDTTYGITFNVLSATASALTVQVVSPGGSTSTTTVASSLNPSTAGASVSFTATVTATAPTGTVTFKANAVTISGCGAVSLVGTGNVRTAVCATAALAVGTHSIVATYNGDGTNPTSTSTPLSQTVNAVGAGANVALATAGASASASSTYDSGHPVSAIINNERTGLGWGSGGGWRDGTSGVWPDWVQINFSGSKTIDRVVVYSVQDNVASPIEPTATTTFSLYGVRDFTVQGWNGSSWITLGTVTANNLVKRTVTFTAYTTDRIRINVTNALNSYSRLIEVEAWTPGVPPAPTTTTLTSSTNPSTLGASVTFTASVTGSAPTGTVAFSANSVTIAGCGAVSLAGTGNVRTAACTTNALAAGSHSIVAAYGGNAGNAPSTSAPLTQTVSASPVGTNVALATAGASASASSTYDSGHPVSAIINNERTGLGWGSGAGWRDGTYGAWPDWVQINFNGSKTIDRVVVYSVQDNVASPIEPTATTTFSLYGLRDFTVQGWNGSSWITLGTVTANNLVKRTVTFTAYTTDRIRVNVTSALNNYSRIIEVEAWTAGSPMAMEARAAVGGEEFRPPPANRAATAAHAR